MAVDKKISQLTSGAPAQAGDEYVVARSGANFKLTLTNIAASMPPIGATTPNTGSFTSLTNSGNLNFSGTGQRITGDMANATLTNRLAFQNSVTNANTPVNAIPNGTGTGAGFRGYGASDPTNAPSVSVFQIGTTDSRIASEINGTASYTPMTFYTGGSERMRLSTTGEFAVGFGGNSGQGIFQVARTISGGGPATSGTTDANQVMAFNASSVQLGYGAYANGTGWIQQRATANYATNYDLVLQPNGGNVGIGGTPNAAAKLHILGTYPTSGNTTVVNWVNGTIPSGTTTNYYSYLTQPATQAASFTLGNLNHFFANQGTIGASSAITNQYGFYADSNLTGATNNYGFFSNIASGTNRWNFYANGTAKNYFAGQVGINKDPSAQLNVSADTGTIAYFQNSSGVGVYINAGDNTWTSASDERLKTDLAPIESAVEKLSFVRAVTGRYKKDAEVVSRSFLIAQDVQKVFPQAVSNDNPDELGLRYTDMIPLLVAAIKELSAKVAALEAK